MKTLGVLLLCVVILCATESVSGKQCPWGWESFESFCYYVGSSSMTSHQARRFCQRMGGDLVKITSGAENEFVLALARKKVPLMKQMWIGLMWTSSSFYWNDYSVPAFKNWAPHEPNGNAREPCSNMWTGHTSFFPQRASGYWNDRTCGVFSSFPCGLICKKLP